MPPESPSTNMRQDQQREGERQQPEGDVVHARERHVRRADHQRHQPVAEAADHGGHDHEEHHDQAVAGDEHVEGVRLLEDLQAGIHQLGAHHHREEAADAGPRTIAKIRYIVPMSLWFVE